MVPTSGEPTTSMVFFCPNWLKQGQKATLLHDNIYKHGYLNLDKENLWEFVTCDAENCITSKIEIADLQYSWKMQMQENTFDVGWEDYCARRIFGNIIFVSAAHLHFDYTPANLRVALVSSNPDQKIWDSACNEEYDRLKDLDVFTKITEQQYKAYLREFGEDARAIPTMNLFTIKLDIEANLNQAKSRIVALGNLE